MKLFLVMTVDVDPPIPSNPNPDIVKDGVLALLKLFDKYAIKATFFVPAVVAEKFPLIINGIVEKGHEVACHGLNHDPKEATLGISEELRIIRTATKIIQSATGVRPVGFRAPLFNVNESCWIALQKTTISTIPPLYALPSTETIKSFSHQNHSSFQFLKQAEITV